MLFEVQQSVFWICKRIISPNHLKHKCTNQLLIKFVDQASSMIKFISLCSIICSAIFVFSQSKPDKTYQSYIKSISFYKSGDPLSYPIVRLHSTDLLELHFDDLEGGVKNYYYAIQLCNADWLPAQLNYFDYAKGYSQMRISNYKASSISLTRYTHYQANIPDKNCMPTKSGNYLLKVFLDGDTSKLPEGCLWWKKN